MKNKILFLFLFLSFSILFFSFFKSNYFFSYVSRSLEETFSSMFHKICYIKNVSGDITSRLVIQDFAIYENRLSLSNHSPLFYAKKMVLEYSFWDIMAGKPFFKIKFEDGFYSFSFDKNRKLKILKPFSAEKQGNLKYQLIFNNFKVKFSDYHNNQFPQIFYFKDVAGVLQGEGRKFNFQLAGKDENSIVKGATDVYFYMEKYKGKNFKWQLKVKNGDLSRYGNYLFKVKNSLVYFEKGKFNLNYLFWKNQFGEIHKKGDIEIDNGYLYFNKIGNGKLNLKIKIEDDKFYFKEGTFFSSDFSNAIILKDGFYQDRKLFFHFIAKDLSLNSIFSSFSYLKSLDLVKGNFFLDQNKNNYFKIEGSFQKKKMNIPISFLPGEFILNNLSGNYILDNNSIFLKKLQADAKYNYFPVKLKITSTLFLPKFDYSNFRVKGDIELENSDFKLRFLGFNKSFSVYPMFSPSNQGRLDFSYQNGYLIHKADFKFKFKLKKFFTTLFNSFSSLKKWEAFLPSGNIEFRYRNSFISDDYQLGKPIFNFYSREIYFKILDLELKEFLLQFLFAGKEGIKIRGKFFVLGTKFNFKGKWSSNGFHFYCVNVSKFNFKRYKKIIPEYILKKINPQRIEFICRKEKGSFLVEIKIGIAEFYTISGAKFIFKQRKDIDFSLEKIEFFSSHKKNTPCLVLNFQKGGDLNTAYGSGKLNFCGNCVTDNKIVSYLKSLKGNFEFLKGKLKFEHLILEGKTGKKESFTAELSGFLDYLDFYNPFYSIKIKGNKELKTSFLPKLKLKYDLKLKGKSKNYMVKGKVKVLSLWSNPIEFLLLASNYQMSNFWKSWKNNFLFLDLYRKKIWLKIDKFPLEKIGKIFTPFLKIEGYLSGTFILNWKNFSFKVDLKGNNLRIANNLFRKVELKFSWNSFLVPQLKVEKFLFKSVKEGKITLGQEGNNYLLEIYNLKLPSGKIKSLKLSLKNLDFIHKKFEFTLKEFVFSRKGTTFSLQSAGNIFYKEGYWYLDKLIFVWNNFKFLLSGKYKNKDKFNLFLKIIPSQFSLSEICLKKNSSLDAKFSLEGKGEFRKDKGESYYYLEGKINLLKFVLGTSSLSQLGKIKFFFRTKNGDFSKLLLEKSEVTFLDNKLKLSGFFDFNKNIVEFRLKAMKFNLNNKIKNFFSLLKMKLPKWNKGTGALDIVFRAKYFPFSLSIKGDVLLNKMLLEDISFKEQKDKINFPDFLKLDIKLKFADRIIVKNSSMNLRIKGFTNIKGGKGQLYLEGKMRILNGSKLYYLGKEFQIISGKFDFMKYQTENKLLCPLIVENRKKENMTKNKPINKVFHPTLTFSKLKVDDVFSNPKTGEFEDFYLKAFTRIGNYLIYIEINNHNGKKETNLYSVPSLSKQQIVALLMSGNDDLVRERDFSQDEIYNEGDLWGSIGADIENKFLYSLTKKIDRKFSLDEFRIYSRSFSDNSSEKTTVFSVGKYVGRKTLLRYQKGLNSEGHYLNLDYDVDKNFRLNSQYDLEDGKMRFGIQFNRFFK